MILLPLILLLLALPLNAMEGSPDVSNPATYSLHHMGLCAHFIPSSVSKRDDEIAEKFKAVVLDVFLDVAQDKKNQGVEPKFTRDLLAGKLLAEAESDYRDKAQSYRHEYRDTSLTDDDVNSLAWDDHYCESALYIVEHYQFDESSVGNPSEEMDVTTIDSEAEENAPSSQLASNPLNEGELDDVNTDEGNEKVVVDDADGKEEAHQLDEPESTADNGAEDESEILQVLE